MIWHSSTAEEVLNELQVDDKTGLANGVADMRLEDLLILFYSINKNYNVKRRKEKMRYIYPNYLYYFKYTVYCSAFSHNFVLQNRSTVFF